MSNRELTFNEKSSVTLIGMAGAGKSTLAPMLAKKLDWENVDTDLVIEAHYGTKLQTVVDNLGNDGFRVAEEEIISNFGAIRTVISTGGSVVYGPRAMERLKSLGPIIALNIDVETCLKRVGTGKDRGLSIKEGQTVEDLYNERVPLYKEYADFTVDTHLYNASKCVDLIYEWLKSIEQ